MAAPTTPCRRRIRPLGGAVIGALAVVGSAVAQPVPPGLPEPAKSPEIPVFERPIVGVIDLRADLESRAIARELDQAIRRAPDLQPIDATLGFALAGAPIDLDAGRIERAREALEKAREEIASFQLELALVRAREGRDELLDARPTPETTSLLADLVFTEGLAAFAAQQKRAAHAAFALVHALDPGRTLDPDRYLGELVVAFEAAARRAAGTGTIEVTTNGTLWLDGRPQTRTTLEVHPGLHVLVASGVDYLSGGRLVEVAAGQTVQLELRLRAATVDVKAGRARQALMRAPDPTARAGAIQRIAELAHLNAAVIVTSDGDGGLAVQLWRDRAPGFGEVKAIASTLTADEADRIVAPLVPKRPEPVVEPGGPPFAGPREPPKQWYQKRWVQAGLVGGALAVIGGILWARAAMGADERPVVFGEATGRE